MLRLRPRAELEEDAAAPVPQPADAGCDAETMREIIRFRDRGVRAYDSLTPGTLCRIATTSVPELAHAVRVHLEG